MADARLDAYMRDLETLPLLNEAEHAALGKCIALGHQAAERLPYATTEAERAELQDQIAAGTRARERLISANLRWVVKLAYRHYGRSDALIDRVQDGNLGLMRATLDFDAEKGSFSTYATFWIRQAMQRGWMVMRDAIWLPEHLQFLRARIARLTQTLGRQPSVDELAQMLDCKPKHIRYALSETSACSLDEPLSDGADAGTLGELTPDPYTTDPEEYILQADERRELFEALSRIGERERAYLMHRYGLDDGEVRSREQACAELGIEDSGHALEARALQAMRRAYRDIYREGQARSNALLAPPGQVAGQPRR
jgi:RNA polymerase sigma factor (sigma-70 family)